MYGSQARFFDDEISPKHRHTTMGCVGMASAGPNLNASQFYITLADSLDSLDEKHTVFGQVNEGLEILEGLNDVPVDSAERPLQNIRIRHTILLDDPFDDPLQLPELMPDASPLPQFEQGDRLEEDWVPTVDDRPADEVENEARAAEAQNRAVVLEMIGDLPEADVKPPSNMLFVCKLNPVTTEEDLEIIFSRFGNVTSCDIIKDYKTGDSLCYAFIGYDNDTACEAAYFKMNNVLVDDRRIKVDFSQSVSHIWKQFKRHGKKGGTAETAAEADGHIRGPGGGRGGSVGDGAGADRYQARHQQQPQSGSHGMLFDYHDEQVQRQHQQTQPQQQRHTLSRHEQQHSRGASGAERGIWSGQQRGYEAADRHGRSRSRSKSRSSTDKRQHKKHKKARQEKDDKLKRSKERRRSVSRRAAADAAASPPGGRHGHGKPSEGGRSSLQQYDRQAEYLHETARHKGSGYGYGWQKGSRNMYSDRDEPSRADYDGKQERSRDGYSYRQQQHGSRDGQGGANRYSSGRDSRHGDRGQERHHSSRHSREEEHSR
eukprot:GHRR01029801.1.p1 GENE.GHRR01029801.1~~GHRR01029801.1.p1  ORF type:complete len:544 (+),score=208.73 GHRR01029801.1:463-2094(+)